MGEEKTIEISETPLKIPDNQIEYTVINMKDNQFRLYPTP